MVRKFFEYLMIMMGLLEEYDTEEDFNIHHRIEDYKKRWRGLTVKSLQKMREDLPRTGAKARRIALDQLIAHKQRVAAEAKRLGVRIVEGGVQA